MPHPIGLLQVRLVFERLDEKLSLIECNLFMLSSWYDLHDDLLLGG
jgi:hypothetical protein